jgi:adenosylcobinamide-phosphate synthase
MVEEILIIILASFVIDLMFGELPSPIHPVVWMGNLIEKMKSHFFLYSKYIRILYGFIMTISLILVFISFFTIILVCSSFNQLVFILVAALLLSTTFSVRTLLRSAGIVAKDIDEDINKGRKSLSFLVSRPTSKLSLQEVVSATIETLTENIVDSVVAPIFYTILIPIFAFFLWSVYSSLFLQYGSTAPYQLLVIFAVAAGVSYRVVNTLDAMVGYKDPVNIDIGWFPAKLDDLLNFLPARITGFLIVISAFLMSLDYKQSWRIMLKDARNTPSPNSGYPMAAAAGALNVQLHKPGTYKLGKPQMNLTIDQIKDAIKLSTLTVSLFSILFSLFLMFIIINS